MAIRWDCSNISWNEAISQIRSRSGTNFDTIHTSKDIFLELVRNIGVQNKALPTQYMEELREYFSCNFLTLRSTPNNVLFFTSKGKLVAIGLRQEIHSRIIMRFMDHET
jgi:hypothetical protein